MNCPECGGASSRVIVTRLPINAPATRCRRRQCNACGHRFYTLQSPEVVVAQHEVEWFGTELCVDAAALRRLRGPAN